MEKSAGRVFVSLLFVALINNATAQNFWGPTNGPYGGDIKAFLINSIGHIFVGTNGGGVFRSTDDGDTWTEANTGLTSLVVQAFAVNPKGEIFAGTGNGIFRSANSGEQWTPINTGLDYPDVTSFAINRSGQIFAGTSGGGVFRSQDNGNTWIKVNVGLTSSMNVQALAINSDDKLFAGTNTGVFISSDHGADWTPTNLTNNFVQSLAIKSDSLIFAGTNGNGVFLSIDNGGSWTPTGLWNKTVTALAINLGTGDIVGGTDDGIFLSTDNGKNWMPANTGLTDTSVNALAIPPGRDGYIFAGTSGGGVFRSTNNGNSWSAANNGVRNSVIEDLIINSKGQIFAGSRGGLFRSTDGGENWLLANTGLEDTYVLSLAINYSNGYIFAGTRKGKVFLSKNSGESWIPARAELPDARIESLAINSRGEVFAGTSGGGAFRSTNNGDRWEPINTGLTDNTVLSLAINQSTGDLFAGTSGGGVFRFDNGSSWTAMNNGLTNKNVASLAINSGGDIFAGTNGGGIFRSTDNGSTWTPVNNGLPNTVDVFSFTINQLGHIYAGTSDGIFRSIDNGENWSVVNTGLPNAMIFSLAINANGHIGAGTEGAGVYRTTRKPRSFTHALSSPRQAGQPISIDANIDNEVAIYSAGLSYRLGGSAGFIPTPMLINGASIQATIPERFVTSRGVEYFLQVTDVDGFKSQLPALGYFSAQVSIGGEGEVKRDAQGNSIPQQHGNEQTAYRMISMPLEVHTNTPKAVLEDDLGPYDIKKWRFWELRDDYLPSDVLVYNEFPNTSEMRPGKAFWLIVKEMGKVIDTGACASNQTDLEYAIALHPKWNFIGNPFNFPIPTENLRLKSRGKPPTLRFYSGEWNNVTANPVREILPFEGYAVFDSTFQGDTLFINPDLSASLSQLHKQTASQHEDILFSIQILSQCQEARDVDNVVAVAASASRKRDDLDQPEPPVIGEYVSVYFPHRDWQTLAKTYCIDARPDPAETGEVWEFEVKTNIRDKVNLTFEGIDDVPKELEVWLVDDALKITQNLREAKQYAVAGAGGEHPKQLKLVVGKRGFVDEKLAEARVIPTSYELSQNFPNPFNPATTIRYGLPQVARVTLKIYNLLGEEVARLINDELRAAGYHAAIWDGRDKDGRVVASGVYVYRLQAGSSVVLTKKLALIK